MSVCNMLMALKAIGVETKTSELTKTCEELQVSINLMVFRLDKINKA